MPDAVWIVGGVVLALAFVGINLLIAQLIGLYVQAMFSGAKVTLIELIGMRLRKVDVRAVVHAYIHAKKSGLDLSTKQLETHALVGGRIRAVVSALIAARQAHIPLTWDFASAIDLAGRDVVQAVETSIKIRAFDGPPMKNPHVETFQRLFELARPLGSAEDANEWRAALDTERTDH